jgi:DNA-binding transcriptional MerR regulator
MSSSNSGFDDSVISSTFGRLPSEARNPIQTRYSMSDLEELTGLPARTIRFYIQEGMLNAAIGRGPSATYGRDHLLRLLRITELKAELGKLTDVKVRLKEMSTDELESHFAARGGPEEERWRRVKVHPRMELHVRESSERNHRFEQALEQIVQHARIVLEHYESGRS